jgi:hypothetical protein
MPRKASLDAMVALHHIIIRGIEQQKYFTMIPTAISFYNE